MTVFDEIKLPKMIYETQSKYNGKIQVFEVGKTRKLIVDGYSQSLNPTSPSCNKLVWGKAVDVLVSEVPDLKNVMILGLGGGTMAHLISKKLNQPDIVSVELDPVMVEVAKKYFDVESISNHRIINEDALRVVVDPAQYELEPSSFDALIVDIYCGEKYPDLGRSGNFISAVENMVKTGGLVMFNRMYLEKHQDDVNVFIDYVQNFLTDVKCLVVAGYTNSDNVLIYGRR